MLITDAARKGMEQTKPDVQARLFGVHAETGDLCACILGCVALGCGLVSREKALSYNSWNAMENVYEALCVTFPILNYPVAPPRKTVIDDPLGTVVMDTANKFEAMEVLWGINDSLDADLDPERDGRQEAYDFLVTLAERYPHLCIGDDADTGEKEAERGVFAQETRDQS